MNAVNNRLWVTGGLVLTALILVTGWFVGVAPVLGQAAAADTERVAVIQKNRAEEVKLSSLKERSEGLEQLKSLVEGQRKMLPASADIAELIGQLNAMQQQNGVVLTEFAVSDGLVFEPPVDESVAEEVGSEEADGGTQSEAELASDGGTADAPMTSTEIPNANLVTSENFVAIPVSVSANGSLQQLLAFVESVQSGERLFLVTELAVGEDEQDLTFTADLTGYVYVLIDPTVAIPSGAAADVAATASEGAG